MRRKLPANTNRTQINNRIREGAKWTYAIPTIMTAITKELERLADKSGQRMTG